MNEIFYPGDRMGGMGLWAIRYVLGCADLKSMIEDAHPYPLQANLEA